jgi:phosphoesterase RecJ-like protein
MYDNISAIGELVAAAQRVLVIQADNPDGDSLGSSLALEHILSALGKEVYLYCGVDIPGYLKYVPGFDRVNQEFPSSFDLSIIVDASTMTLLEKIHDGGLHTTLASKPCIVLDHHAVVEKPIYYATESIIDATRASAGELIYLLAKALTWQMPLEALEAITVSILGDTQGLSNQLASATTYMVMSEMVAAGVNRPKIEEARRELSKMPMSILQYKGRLLARTEFFHDGTIAINTIPQQEITTFSPLYNPGPLVQFDMLQTIGVKIAIVFKSYDDGKVTAAIRCNAGYGVGGELAEKFGGGGHAFAAGFKTTDNRTFDEIKAACINQASQLLSNLTQAPSNETPQYAYSTD